MRIVGKAAFVRYSVQYVSCGVYIPKIDTVCKSVSVLVVLYVCPECWLRNGALNFGLMKTDNCAVAYVWRMAMKNDPVLDYF
jgi:hypothetical protein